MPCEDFPCCGHEYGCCPDFGPDGEQINMKCVCGATVPLGSPSSLCATCRKRLLVESGAIEDPDEEIDFREDYYLEEFLHDDRPL